MIYLQKYDCNKFDREEESLAREFTRRGFEVKPFYGKDILRNRLKITKDDLVAGNITIMHNVFKQLGVEVPETHDYPDVLKPYLKRRVWSGKLNNIIRPIEEGYSNDVFIKPKDRLKRFTGFVVKGMDSLYQLANISKHTEVWASDVVYWISEYRVYVVNGKVRGIKYYNGNPDVQLDLITVDNAIDDYENSGLAPKAYGIDFGVLDTGETALIEVNDGYSIGNYDLDDKDYADLIETVTMTHWTLILTIVINWNATGHSQIQHIDGFTTRESCQTAGDSWKSKVSLLLPQSADGTTGRVYSWTCVGM